MAISTVRRLAADILGVGENRIRLSPENLKEVEGAMTRADVKGLIKKGIVKKIPVQGRASTRKHSRTTSGHRRGHRVSQKTAWMEKVRAQRKFLVMLLTDGVLKKDQKWSLYRKIKSGIFRNKKAMLLYLKDNGLISKTYEVPVKEYKPKATARAQLIAPKPNPTTSHSSAKPVAPSGDIKKKDTALPAKKSGANIGKGEHK